MATFGVLLTTVIVSGLTWCVLAAMGIALRPIDCLLFRVLISPTDPIAVLSLLKEDRGPGPAPHSDRGRITLQ